MININVRIPTAKEHRGGDQVSNTLIISVITTVQSVIVLRIKRSLSSLCGKTIQLSKNVVSPPQRLMEGIKP